LLLSSLLLEARVSWKKSGTQSRKNKHRVIINQFHVDSFTNGLFSGKLDRIFIMKD
jgi:hypothetical protein